MTEAMAEPSDADVIPLRRDDRPLREVLGEVLREERVDQGRTLAEVAAAAHVSLPYLSEVERGRKEPSSDIVAAVARALELPLPEVLERSAGRLRAGAQRRQLALLAA